MPENDGEIPGFVVAELGRLALRVPPTPEQLTRLARYLDLLLETNQKFNLTGIRDREAAWRRHIIDSLTLLPLLAGVGKNARLMDVGSGGGLPGIPLAITRPDLRMTLLEATGKKARFLAQCVKDIPLPNVTVLNRRAETAGQDSSYREKFDIVVCRAVGPLNEILEYTLPLVHLGGELLAMKGPKVEEELDRAADAMMILGAGELQVIQAYPDDWGMDTVIVRLTKERPTPDAYPRLPGMPRLEPL